jgi:hypothetical protein
MKSRLLASFYWNNIHCEDVGEYENKNICSKGKDGFRKIDGII